MLDEVEGLTSRAGRGMLMSMGRSTPPVVPLPAGI